MALPFALAGKMSVMWSEDFVEEYNPYKSFPYPPPGIAPEYEVHTGDPRQDIEYERQYQQQQTFIIPEHIKVFLTYFRKCIVEQNVYGIQDAYENGFNKLTDRFFKTNPWPDADVVAPIVGNDHTFLILYKELYFRHIYARVPSGPTLEQRFESYYNYCNLFNYILNADRPAPLELPNQWLWDIIDEFIYQFQSFSIYRCKVNKKPPAEIDHLRAHPKIWNVHSVLNVLHSLVEKSSINRQLEVYTNGGDPDSVAGEFGQLSLYKMLGYFSLIGLLRLHSLLGDYYQALKVLENIDFNKKNMYSRVPACQITTFYYVGFAYMMMRRYQDAIRTFSNILLYIQRTKQMFQTKAQMYDQITKMNDKMYTMLAICLVLHPIRIDESVHSQLREKFADKMLRLQKGDMAEFETNFGFACPKFLSPVPPNYDTTLNIADFHKEPFQLQLRAFLEEVSQQIHIPTIRSYLKLYTTLPISKLATFMDINEDELRTHLMCFKHKMKNVVWTKGTSGLEGEFQSASEVDFYIDRLPYILMYKLGPNANNIDPDLPAHYVMANLGLCSLQLISAYMQVHMDMIHIADTKVARRYGDFFIRQIHKFEEITKSLKSLNA